MSRSLHCRGTFKVFLAIVASSQLCLQLSLAQTNQPPAAAPAAPAPTVKFRPQFSGAASVRVTGGSRGTGPETVALDVLAPDEVGITTQEQPSLFWFQSKPANARFELTLLQDNKVKPLVDVRVEIWYDALAALSDQIDAHPDDQALRQSRADLLRQVGLKTAADAELANK
jgi:hypothetical protein